MGLTKVKSSEAKPGADQNASTSPLDAGVRLCGTCRFWGAKDEAGQTFRQCMRILHDDGNDTDVDKWDAEDADYYAKEDPERFAKHQAMLEEKAVALDGSGYFAALRCREDFGCVYHECRVPIS